MKCHLLIACWLYQGALAATPPAVPHDSVHGTVSLKDIDVASAAGTAEAMKRIVRMAQHLCSTFGNTSRISDRETTADCVRDAVAEARGRLSATTAAQLASR